MTIPFQRASDLPWRVRAPFGGYMGGTPCGDSKSFFFFLAQVKRTPTQGLSPFPKRDLGNQMTHPLSLKI